VTRAVYTGHETLTFTDYRDEETGRTLTAEPGRVYEVAPASGRLVEDIPAGWFVPADPEEWAAKQAAAAEAERLAAESAAPESGDDGAGAPPEAGATDEQQPEAPQD
jgi:hypothetical protein